MPRIKQETVYTFDELDERAKERARDWYREGALNYEWWDCTFDDARECLKLAGFDVREIYFEGFSHQGQGASFNGAWSAGRAQPVKAMKAHAPQDKDLHAIAAEARAIAKLRPDASMGVKHTGRGYFISGDDCSVYCEREVDDVARTPAQWAARDAEDREAEDRMIELARDAAHWIYRQLEQEYEYQNSDEQVEEMIRANDYDFTAEGKRT